MPITLASSNTSIRQILERGDLEQRLVKLTPLEVAQLGQRWVADDLPDATALATDRA